jgi:predicted transcriptional regulator
MTIYVLPASEQSGSVSAAYPDCAGDVVTNRYELDLASGVLKGVTLAVGDIIDLGPIPANSTVEDVIIDSDDLDSNGSPTIAFDVGVMSGNPGETGTRTCGAEFFAASTVAQAGGVARTTLKTAFRVAPVQTDKSVGLKITTAAATQPATGKLGVSVRVRG